ncbi:MAG: hypothetical protein KKH72_09230 [Alphaproteobacteria bacterium]|nr:hypothetical protein [Alphaproteobacteria bacterium]
MSGTDSLGELAALVGRSAVASEIEAARKRVINGSGAGIGMRPLQRRASDLLGAVLALSARTRRVVQPRVAIDLDVFTPSGRRAVVVHNRRLD